MVKLRFFLSLKQQTYVPPLASGCLSNEKLSQNVTNIHNNLMSRFLFMIKQTIEFPATSTIISVKSTVLMAMLADSLMPLGDLV